MVSSNWANLKLTVSFECTSVVSQVLADSGAFTLPEPNSVVELVARKFPLMQTLIPILEQGCTELET